MAYQRSLAVAAVSLAVLLVGCASTTSGDGGQDKQASLQERAALRLQLASAYYGRGQLDVALAEAAQAVQLVPSDAQAHGMRALILAAKGQTAPAEKDFLYALRLAPHNPELSNNYGLFLCQTGRAAQSLAYFDAALQDAAYASPENALNNGGACSLALHDYRRAGAYLLRAVRIAPDVAVTNAGLVRVYYQQQDYRQAAHYLERLGKIATMESQTADVLWLGIKVQHKLGDAGAEAGLGAHLRNHHSGSSEYAAYQSGAFDE
ncbi:type IV pilus biogenesis/stability protein PilW [Janthinobacterium sp. SUN118]|uniref:type IV pilus biogenesis/stability protein PilW n=1 Tax=Janthinobacterium sp. SUN118 TaxID=3004100 RepID=UPI0025B14ADB|nr:type IV pilus biogenesis/stability protein PilW [Janthinobacterium sp. SUN118]MDN2709049.1 type IV pilus biogenesis/stability protein PilW [Janthinobacterium sp. SUN118]